MNRARSPIPTSRRGVPVSQLRVWHLALLVLFVAIAIVNIQDQRQSEPALIALGIAGFAAYWFLGWLGWRFAHRFEARLGLTPLLILYLVAMAALFLTATVAYLAIEHVYLVGHF